MEAKGGWNGQGEGRGGGADVGVEWNGMEWNGMEWNGRRGQMEWNGMDKWNQRMDQHPRAQRRSESACRASAHRGWRCGDRWRRGRCAWRRGGRGGGRDAAQEVFIVAAGDGRAAAISSARCAVATEPGARHWRAGQAGRALPMAARRRTWAAGGRRALEGGIAARVERVDARWLCRVPTHSPRRPAPEVRCPAALAGAPTSRAGNPPGGPDDRVDFSRSPPRCPPSPLLQPQPELRGIQYPRSRRGGPELRARSSPGVSKRGGAGAGTWT